MTTLSLLVVTSGRPTLSRTLAGLIPQLRAGDEVLIDVNDDAPWGHRARNRLMPRAKGDFLVFVDDDDLYAADALKTIRRSADARPDRMHVFRMLLDERGPRHGTIVWGRRRIAEGNVSTAMVAVPNLPDALGTWGDRYAGDCDFVTETADSLGIRMFPTSR